MSSTSVKRLLKASVEGSVVNDKSADANSFISFDLDLQSNNISSPFGAQQEDSRKRKAIVSGGMVERDNNNCIQLLQMRDLPASVQEDSSKDKAIVSADMVGRDKNNFVHLLQRRKRMSVNSSSSREVNRFTVGKDSNPCSSSGFATQGKIQDCRNYVFVNSSRDDTSERNISFSSKPQGFSGVHQNERQVARLEKTRGGLLSLFSAGDQGNSSEAGSPEVIFLGSRRSTQRNHSFTIENSDIVEELSRGVEVDDHTPIDVDSLEYTTNETVNLEESNKEASARARQIDQDELLARQIQEELAREKGERGVQASCGTGGRREPSHYLTTHPSLTPFLAGHSTCPLHRRRDRYSTCPLYRRIDGHLSCPLHRRRDGHLTCPLHRSRDVQSTCPLHRRRDDHPTCPLHTSRDGHSTCPLHKRDGGHSTCPLHRRIDGHPTCPLHTRRDGHLVCPLYRRDGGHSTCPPHSRRDGDSTCLLHRRDELSGRWQQASGRPFHCSRFQFPSDRNIDMRVDVLEAMERAVERNATHHFLAGAQRDLNESDYDKLLVLDDDNNNWKGASQRHIDGLPISTVQNDTSDDEVCSICLEKLKTGDVIRHLLCTHKFHKECIDPWLATQASCPICKLSIKVRQLFRRQLA